MIESVAWADAELECIEVDYDDVSIQLTESLTGQVKRIRCCGHIGFQFLGFWDEIVVESIRLETEHEFLVSCLGNLDRRYPHGLPETGQEMRNNRSWRVLVLRLSDGAEFHVVANEFLVE